MEPLLDRIPDFDPTLGAGDVARDIAPDYWNSVQQAAANEVTKHSTNRIPAYIVSFNAGRSKADVRRVYNDNPDGILYPIAAGFQQLEIADLVYLEQGPGGVVIQGRPSRDTDKNINSIIHRDGTHPMNNTLPIEQSGGAMLRLQRTDNAAPDYNFIEFWDADNRNHWLGTHPDGSLYIINERVGGHIRFRTGDTWLYCDDIQANGGRWLSDHEHDHRYFTEGESDGRFAFKSHFHDDRYFTEGESDGRYAFAGHLHDNRYVFNHRHWTNVGGTNYLSGYVTYE